MLFRVKKKNNKNKFLHHRILPSFAAVAAGVAMFGLVAFTPVTIDFGGTGLDLVAPAAAHAKNDKGGDKSSGRGGSNGSSNSGGNNGSSNSGGNNGSNNSGGNGGNKGGNKGGSKGGTGGNDVSSSSDDGGDSRLRMPTIPTVAMAVFTTAIKKRYPSNDVEILEDPHQAVSFFNELHAMAGKRVTHRWVHNGSVMFEANFDVLAQRWRIWSTQLLPADQAGEWTVEVVDEDGKIIETRTISYQPKDAEQLALR